MFSLDKLNVYQKALANAASLAQHCESWDKRHAVTDQLLRASERQVDKAGTSLVLNIAEANGRYASGERRNLFDIAESAVVRVGTYLELCARTDKLNLEQKDSATALLDGIASMLRGLASD